MAVIEMYRPVAPSYPHGRLYPSYITASLYQPAIVAADPLIMKWPGNPILSEELNMILEKH